MKDMQREILSQVASGTISAEEGAARLEALASEPSSPPVAAAPASTAVRQIKVVSRFGNAEIVGDASVASAVAEGPHRVRLEGDTMQISQSLLSEDTSFEFVRPAARVVVNGLDFGNKLVVRMNPDLPLAVKVQAGSIRVAGIHGPITAEVQASTCIVTDFRAPIKLAVTAGSAEAQGRLDSGSSSIRCDMGEVKLKLAADSNVRIAARSTMGKIALESEHMKKQDAGMTIGSGAGTLDLECTMGDIQVTV